MNTTTMKQFNEIKNETVTVVSFSATGEQKRTMMISGVGIIRAVEEVRNHQMRGEISMIVGMEEGDKVRSFERHDSSNFEFIKMPQFMDMINRKN